MSTSGDVGFESLLDTVGPFGTYQWLLCAFLWWLAAPLLAATVYGHMLLLLTPDHWCAPTTIDRTDWNSSDWLINSVETLKGQDRVNRCPTPIEEVTANSSWARYSVLCQHGWNYDYEKVYPTIVSELNWVCGESWRVFACHTGFWAGGAVGVVVLGAAADRFGRRPVIAVTHLICACAGLATNYLTTSWSFLAGRILVGFAALPMSMTTYVLMLEYVSSQWRLTVSTLYLFSYSLVGCLLPWLASWIHNWRMFNLLVSLPTLAIPMMYCLIPESLRWMLVKGQNDKLKNTLSTIARINGRPVVAQEIDIVFSSDMKVKMEETTLLTMIRLPYLRTVYSITLATWVLMSCCYVGGYVLASTSSDPFLLVSSNAAVDLLANALGDRLAGRLGRRTTMAGGSLAAAVALIALSCVPAQEHHTHESHDKLEEKPATHITTVSKYEPHRTDGAVTEENIRGESGDVTGGWWVLGLLLMARVALTSAYNVNYLYGAEVYPTVVRTRALALRQALGAVGSFLSPQIVYLSTYSPRLPLLVFGCMCLSSCLLSLLVPETLNARLPETLLDAQALKQTELACPGHCPCPASSCCFNAKKTVQTECPRQESRAEKVAV